jgi:hypothetical protein
MLMNKQITLAIMLAAIAAIGISGIATSTYADNDKRVRIDLNIKVQNMKGDKGDASTVPGPQGQPGADSQVPGPIGATGPKGDSGNVTVYVCQVGTSNCVSENVGPNSTLTIFVNATGSVVPGNTTVPVEPPVICEPPAVLNATTNQCETPIVVEPPINETGNVTLPEGNTTG